MSKKLGVNEEHEKGKDHVQKDQIRDKRIEIDKKAARQ